MNELLQYTMFQEVYFPSDRNQLSSDQVSELTLSKMIRMSLAPSRLFRELPMVVFDFETTGLDAREDRIVEVGAIKLVNGEAVDEFSTLVNPGILIPDHISSISGINNQMVADKPSIETVLPKMLEFISGSLLFAHNADFDMAFLTANASRLGYELHLPCFCTFKLSRQLLPQLESRSLDRLAQHYGLSFVSRHRSIGDAQVTATVFHKMLDAEGSHLNTWGELQAIAGTKQS